jgi:hypothetical protein
MLYRWLAMTFASDYLRPLNCIWRSEGLLLDQVKNCQETLAADRWIWKTYQHNCCSVSLEILGFIHSNTTHLDHGFLGRGRMNERNKVNAGEEQANSVNDMDTASFFQRPSNNTPACIIWRTSQSAWCRLLAYTGSDLLKTFLENEIKTWKLSSLSVFCDQGLFRRQIQRGKMEFEDADADACQPKGS